MVLPIYGQAVPFHLSILKNVSKSDEGDHVLLRFNFITPGQATGKKEGHVSDLSHSPLTLLLRHLKTKNPHSLDLLVIAVPKCID